MRKIFVSLILIIIFASQAFAAAAVPQVPRAQLDESERYFNRAYMYFMERDYWNALDYLEGALRANTYLVDYYLLRGLTLQRIGDVNGAREALSNYLEVRPLDTSAPRFAADLERQERLFRFIMGTRPVNSRWNMRGANFQNEWKTGYTRPFNIRGLGKVNSLNKSYCFADTLGSKIYFITGDERNFTVINTPEQPACATPMGDGIYYIFAPGHTTGTSIVIVEAGDVNYLIHGDVTYTDEALYMNKLSIATEDKISARDTLNKVREFIKNNPTIYVSTHTPLGYENIENKKIVDLDKMPEPIPPKKIVAKQATGKYVCGICGYVYDPAENNGVKLEDLPADWKCPRCKQSKENFNKA